jgi:hypothetical protein
MEFHKISVKVGDHEVSKLQQFIVSLGDIRNSISVKKSESVKELKITFYTFSIETDVIKEFLPKFNQANLKVVSQDEMNEILRPSRQSNAAYQAAVNTDINPADLQTIKRKKTLQDYIDEGEYSVLLNISKNIRLEQNKRDRAEAALPAAIKNAIEINFDNGMNSKRSAFVAVEELVSIATNAELKNLRLNYILENAGYKAIEICTHYNDYADELIKIANNIKMPYIICLKAAVKFSEITLRDDRNFRFEYEADINFASKNTNLRWLRIVSDSVESELTEDEKQQFNKLMSFVEWKKLGN